MWEIYRLKLCERFMDLWKMLTNTLSGWRNDQNKNCRARWVLQLLCSWLFHLKSFIVSKCFLKLSSLQIQIWSCSNKVIWTNAQNKSCRAWWVLQLLCSWLFEVKSFGVSKFCLKLSFIEIQNLNFWNNVTWEYDQNKLIEHDFRKF